MQRPLCREREAVLERKQSGYVAMAVSSRVNNALANYRSNLDDISSARYDQELSMINSNRPVEHR